MCRAQPISNKIAGFTFHVYGSSREGNQLRNHNYCNRFNRASEQGEKIKEDRGNDALVSQLHPKIKLIRVVHIKRIYNMRVDRLQLEFHSGQDIGTNLRRQPSQGS